MRLRLLSVLAAALALGISASFAYFVHTSHARQAEERMEVAAQRIEQQMAEHILALRAIKGAFAAVRTLPDRQFLLDMIAAMPEQSGTGGAQGYGFALAMRPGDEESVSARIQREYGEARAPWPATGRPIAYPIVLLEPQDERNRRALGFDMYSEPIRREAMDNAAKSRGPAISRPVELVQEYATEGRQRGVLLYMPLFAKDRSGQITSPKGEALGFIYIPFRASDLIKQVLSTEPAINVNVEVYSEAITPANLLHASPVALSAPIQMAITVADRKWVLLISEVEGKARLNPAYVVMLIGLILAGAAGALVNAHLSSVASTERLAQERQSHIEQRELMLGEMQHRIKNSIARMLAMFRLTARETADKADLVKVFDQRLQAMARAQSLIVSGATDARTLGEIIQQEVGQWQGSGATITPGPEVELDVPQVQAVGLILHELSTNALKYGALAAGQPLQVSWKREGDAVVLDWHEDITGRRAEPIKAGSGFGSRFMRMMVEGQLAGSFERSLTDKSFHMRIRFPVAPAERD